MASGGVDFESLDGLPTRLILLVLSPIGQREQHAAILGRLARLLRDRTWQYQLQIRQPAEDFVRRLLRMLGD